MSEFKKADELCELSKNDRAIIVGSEIREAIQELRDGISKRDDLIERMREALTETMVLLDSVPTRAHDMAKDEHLREIGRIVNVKGLYQIVKAALSAAERGESDG
jgi:hypothetical protein